jgi:hypothetical protein
MGVSQQGQPSLREGGLGIEDRPTLRNVRRRAKFASIDSW